MENKKCHHVFCGSITYYAYIAFDNIEKHIVSMYTSLTNVKSNYDGDCI